MRKHNLFIALLFTFLLPLTSCSYNKTFVVERSLKNEIININLDHFKEKVENNDRFILYIYSENCSACKILKNEFLDEFINKNHLKLYGFSTDNYDEDEALYFRDIANNDNFYKIYESDGFEELYFRYPAMLLIENKKIINNAIGTGGINQSFFNRNVYLDRNVKKYNVEENYQITLVKSQNPKFILDDENVLTKVLYYTNTLDNDQVKYYLNPFMEDFSYDIYFRINEELTTPYLQIIKDGEVIEKTNKQSNFLSLLDGYVKKSIQ